MPAVNDRRVETRATANGLRLLKISLAPGDATFAAPPAAVSTQSTTTAEGESAANVNVPAASSVSVPFANSTGGEGESEDETLAAAASTINDDDQSPAAVDQAFADVAQSLSVVSATGDALAEDTSSPPVADAVDALLSSSQL
jgi:hypothetical protein